MSTQALMPIVMLLGSLMGQTAPAGLAEKLPLVDRLPPETTNYVFRAGGESFTEKIKGTPAAEVLAEDEVQDLLKSFEETMTTLKDKGPRGIWRLFMASFRCDVVSAHIRGEGDEPEVLTVAIPRTQDEREAMRKAVRGWAGVLFTDLRANKTELPDGVIYGDPASDQGAHLGWLDNRCVFFNGTKAREVLLGPAPKETLVDSEPFTKAVGALKLELPVGFYYYHLEPLWKAATKDDQGLADRLNASGLTSIRAIAGGASVYGGRYHNEHFWVTDERQGGLLKYVHDNPMPAEWLKLIPAEAVSFTYGTVDPQALLSLLFWSPEEVQKEKVEATQPGEQAEEQPSSAPANPNRPGRQAVTQILGVKTDPQLISAMGTRYLVYREPGGIRLSNPAYALFPPLACLVPDQTVIVFELQDEAAFRAGFDVFWNAAKAKVRKNAGSGWGLFGGPTMLREFKYRGETVYEVSDYEFIFGFQAYFHIGSGRLAMASNPELLKQYIRRSSQKEPALTDTAEFKEAMTKVPKNACFLIYMHKGKFFDLLYDNWRAWGQQMGSLVLGYSGAQTDFSFALLPETQTISRHIKASAYLYAVPQADGVLFNGEADLLPLSWWVAQAQIFYDLVGPTGESPVRK